MRRASDGRPTPPLTPAEYWSEIQLVSTEIEDAVVIFCTYEEINRLAIRDEAILEALNKEALFWQAQMRCLQTSLFLTLSRIFDTTANAGTIHTAINASLRNIHLFSADALILRKTRGGPKPNWLDSYMAQAWIPRSAKDLRHIKTALVPYTQRFEKVYRPIRNAMFAHRLISDMQAGIQLFAETNRDEIGAILDFLHDLIDTILNLYLNGFEPVLGARDFSEYNQRVRDGVGRVLRSLRNNDARFDGT